YKRQALRDALALIRYLRDQYGADGALQFTGRRGYRVWVFLKQPLNPSVFPGLVRSLLGSLKLETLELQASLDRRHLFRIPYTLHEDTGRIAWFLDSGLNPLSFSEWSYSLYEPLDPGVVKITRIENLIPKPLILKRGLKSTRLYGYIDSILREGLPDGRKRFILYIASRYLVNVKGYSMDGALEVLQGFLDASCRNYGNCGRVYQSWLRSVLNGVKAGGYMPWSLNALKDRDPDLHRIVEGVLNSG
ncbi:MAG: DNA primase noncatalytic subunit PriX, partial [Desulfurococcales archaeon]|nr:DNA primase noncatalytic subunit PriX [Desulfurococcales archaeon]